MNRIFQKSKIVVAVALVGTSAFLGAQDYNWNMYGSWQNLSSPVDTRISQETIMNETVLRSQKDSSTTAPAPVETTYTPAKSRTRNNLQALGRRMAASDPVSGKQAEELFASTDIIGAVGGVMDQFGLERNNVAHAYALYWVVYWGLANKVYDAPSTAAIQAVAAQAERGFAANADFASMDNAQKQAAAEELMALTAIMDATSEQAKSDPALSAKIATASLEGSRKSGLDLDKMTLTENGFVPAKPRKKADASDAAGDDATALVSAETGGTGADSSTPNYALIAGAAGAGLGAAFLIGKAMGRKG